MTADYAKIKGRTSLTIQVPRQKLQQRNNPNTIEPKNHPLVTVHNLRKADPKDIRPASNDD